ncbi:MAG: T9SS type A sorting domain-containing protein [bacterium]|nr:T9SS type A sorting domain-containing protein [bacterium]
MSSAVLRPLAVLAILCAVATGALAAPGIKTRGRTIIKPTSHLSATLAVQVRVVSTPEPPYPREFALLQNYPNPFNAFTQIRYELASREHARLDVYNMLGRHVDTIVDEDQDAGYYTYGWSRPNLASGIYYYRLQAGAYGRTRSMLLLK